MNPFGEYLIPITWGGGGRRKKIITKWVHSLLGFRKKIFVF
jgi:hypothetical protein